jgi:hypothetical protein
MFTCLCVAYHVLCNSEVVATSDQKVAVQDENKENSVTIFGNKNVTDFAALAANNMGDFAFGKSAGNIGCIFVLLTGAYLFK